MNKQKIKFYIQDVTPELAKRFLEKNIGLSKGDKVKNRRVSEPNVNFLYSQMRSGKWFFTGNTIKFTDTGKLIDGQHTLNALIKANKTEPFLIVEGLDEKVFSVLDTGKKRSAADILSMKGYTRHTLIAGSARAILLYKAGAYSVNDKKRTNARTSNHEILTWVEKNAEIEEVVKYVQSVYDRFGFMHVSTLSMLYWILSEKNQKKCDEFFEKYATGINLDKDSPIISLREKLIKDSVNKTKFTQKDKAALFILAWNAFLLNKKHFSISLSKNYEFPRPV